MSIRSAQQYKFSGAAFLEKRSDEAYAPLIGASIKMHRGVVVWCTRSRHYRKQGRSCDDIYGKQSSHCLKEYSLIDLNQRSAFPAEVEWNCT